MKFYLLFLGVICGCLSTHQLMPMAEPILAETSPQSALPITSTIYIMNSSDYFVRLSVGPEYPSTIALYPEQVRAFPLKRVAAINVSSYGKYSQYLRDFFTEVTKLDIEAMLQEHPEYYSRDCLAKISHEKKSQSVKKDKWKLTLEQLALDETKGSESCDTACVNALYKNMKHPAKAISDPIARDAALIWSIFPRVAAKILKNEAVYPFNILGLDIGGATPTEEQLNNWGQLLFQTSKKRFSSIADPEIWNAVNMIIADSIEWMKDDKYYYVRNPNYPLTLLQIRTPAFDSPQQPDGILPQKLIAELKDTVGDNPAVKMLIARWQWEARVRGFYAADENVPPAPPAPPPPLNPLLVGASFQEKAVVSYNRELGQKDVAEQSFFDKVVQQFFEMIDKLGSEHKKVMLLKYAALERLRMLNQREQTSVQNLSKIHQYISNSMISLAARDGNPGRALNEWISLILDSDRTKAHEYSQKNELELQQSMSEEARAKDYKARLMEHLFKHIKKYEEPQE